MWRSYLLPPLVMVAACQTPLAASVEAYREARFPDAKEHLRDAAREALDRDERARFELYSGLNDLALGNLDVAVVHLSTARALLEADPRLFSGEEQSRLFSAWRALGRLPGQPLLEQSHRSGLPRDRDANTALTFPEAFSGP